MKVRIVEVDTCIGKRYKPQISLFGLKWKDIVIPDYIPQIAKFKTIKEAEDFVKTMYQEPVVAKRFEI